ncbi:MAG: tetratricopeptide repeat protein, partial [candidate division WOR-3 bacterium]
VKPAVPNVSVVDDPIKREILMKQEQSLLKLIVSRPKDFNLYKKLGIIYKELGSFEDAKNCFEYALKLGSKDRDIVRELEALK